MIAAVGRGAIAFVFGREKIGIGLTAPALVLAAGRLAARGPAEPADSEAQDSDADDQTSPFQNGLLARYTGCDGKNHVRLDEQVAFDWGEDPPDRRVPSGPFS